MSHGSRSSRRTCLLLCHAILNLDCLLSSDGDHMWNSFIGVSNPFSVGLLLDVKWALLRSCYMYMYDVYTCNLLCLAFRQQSIALIL